MNHGYRRGFREPRVVVRETDDYVRRRPPPTPPAGDAPESGPDDGDTGPPWMRHWLQPAMVTLLIACVVWPIAHFIPELAPEISATLLWLAPVAMSGIGFATQRRLRHKLLSGIEALHFHLIELGVFFLLIKFASHMDNTIAEVLAIAAQWPKAPLSFFDSETVVAFLLGAAAWWAAGATARDLEAVDDPTMYLGEMGPRERLIRRYFAGGAILMFFAALNRVRVLDVLTQSQGRIRRPIVSALIYFFAGLLLLSMVHITRLMRLWRRDHVQITDSLPRTWLRYLAIFLALASAVAFVLPTGYTIGFLELASRLIGLIGLIAFWLYAILMWPFNMVMKLLMGDAPAEHAPLPPPAPDPQLATPAPGGGAWWEIAKSVLFWVVLSGVVIYLIRSYLRDRPELWQRIQRVRPRQWLRRTWDAVWQTMRAWLAKVRHATQDTLPTLIDRLRAARRQRPAPAPRPRTGATPRAQLIAQYLRMLEQAAAAGHPRRRTTTPYEYAHSLAPELAEATAALRALTTAFVEARYSAHPVTPDEVAAQAANVEQIVAALRRVPTSAEPGPQAMAPDSADDEG